jgi:Tol biopolymer transport system component
MEEVGGKAKGIIVWSSSRLGNHDLFVMNTDGSNVHAITHGDAVDWFPRFSPDGSKILFTRSKKGWVFERDANTDGKWDIYTVSPDGKDETKVVENASWGTWISNDEIVFARSTAIVRRKLGGDQETVLVDSTKVRELDGALLQQPEMSKDGRYLAITLRGSKRETGIWNVKTKTWVRTGEGCQINWSPSGEEVYWVHPTGNGGSRVLHIPIKGGKAAKSDEDIDALTLIDIPGRRSHEYFPQLSSDGKWLVWAATQRGHDHDIADYEIYLWEVGSVPEKAARLTWHSGNDRWPDIFIP